MQFLDNFLFLILLLTGFGLCIRNFAKIYRNISLGKNINRFDLPKERWKTMLKIALGQSKMQKKPIAGVLHILIYVSFLIINAEFIEILIDGILGTHRFIGEHLPHFLYYFFTGILDVLAFLTIISAIIFLVRRNLLHIKRLSHRDLKGWAKKDANWILIIEISLMMIFLLMNGAEHILQKRGFIDQMGCFPISSLFFGKILYFFSNLTLFYLSKICWWLHFIGILFFINYICYSKHLHIFLAFPNTWFSNLENKGKLNNLSSVTKEIKLMLGEVSDDSSGNTSPEKFGADDIFDLNKVQLLNAYTCTECGRCTDVCPANLTGKKLSPRKIMISTRTRLKEISQNIDKNGKFVDDGKKLIGNHISEEEIWACTTCNACVEACPVLIDPLSIIIELRRFLVMEKSCAPSELNTMMTNIENNAAPWQYSQSDRLNWIQNK